MAPANTREFDLVVFGATGFTGERVVAELVRLHVPRFAVAGRSMEKLEAVLNKHGALGVKAIIADVHNPASLAGMAARGAVVLNCVGPYRYFGEQVARACIASGANMLDICGEPEVIEKIEAEFSGPARDKGCFIVSAAGFDSVPADLGTLFTTAKFSGGAPSSVESFLSLHCSHPRGFSGHVTTFECAVMGFASAKELRKLRASNPIAKVSIPGPRPTRRTAPFFDSRPGMWSLPFMGSDASVVRRTQAALGSRGAIKPANYTAYFTVPTNAARWKFVLYGSVFQLLAKFKAGRSLLLKFPRLFTNGLFTAAGPSEEQMDKTSFSMTFYGKGYQQNPPPGCEDPPTLSVKTKVTGPEPGYRATPVFLTQAALTLMAEREDIEARLGARGGVFTAGTLLHGTSYIDRLQANGIQFEDLTQPLIQ